MAKNAFRQTKIIANFDSVRAGGMATVKLPRNIRIHRLDIMYADGTNVMTAAKCAGIFGQHRLKVGSKEIRVWTPADLQIINATRGLPTSFGGTSGIKALTLPMFFSNPATRTSEGEDATALSAFEKFGVNDLTLEIDINPMDNSQTPAAAIEPKLYARVEYDYVVPNITGQPFFMYWRRGSFPIAGATQGVYNTIARPSYYSRIHLKTANTVKLEVKKNSETIIQNDSRAEYESDMAFKGQDVVPNVWSIIGDGTNRIGDIINLDSADTFEIYATTSAADDIGLLYEEMRALGV